MPSQALAKATTFDLYVLDVSTRYIKYRQDQAEGKLPKSKIPSQQEMIEMITRVRKEESERKLKVDQEHNGKKPK